MGDLTGWHPWLVYRSTAPIQVTIDPTGATARLAIRGQRQVGAIATPTGQTEPRDLPREFPAPATACRQPRVGARRHAGRCALRTGRGHVLVVSETTDTDDPVGYASTVWLPRIYRPMERLQLRLTSVFDPEVVVDARVLEVTAIRFQANPGGTPSVVVAVDDLQPAADAGGNGSPGWVFVTGRGCNPTP